LQFREGLPAAERRRPRNERQFRFLLCARDELIQRLSLNSHADQKRHNQRHRSASLVNGPQSHFFSPFGLGWANGFIAAFPRSGDGTIDRAP
jgi:hypothetical protein